MSQNEPPARQASIDRFWSNYLIILRKNSVSVKSLTWYRKHVEAYIKANKNKPLSLHTGQDIDAYLNAKGRLSSVNEWQFRQIADALRLLFTELVNNSWAQTYD